MGDRFGDLLLDSFHFFFIKIVLHLLRLFSELRLPRKTWDKTIKLLSEGRAVTSSLDENKVLCHLQIVPIF